MQITNTTAGPGRRNPAGIRITWSTLTTRLRSSHLRWWPLYLLGVLAVLLIAGDWALPLPESWRSLLLLPATGIVCALALRWASRNEGLMASEGADARVQRDPILDAMMGSAPDSDLSPKASLLIEPAPDRG